MNGLKENRVLQILLAASLVSVLFFGYLLTARDNGTFEIVDIAGDRAYLEPFAFEGIGGDETGMFHFQVENGEVTQTYYPTDGEELDQILQGEKAGKSAIGKYFYENKGRWHNGEMETAPAEGGTVQDVTEAEMAQAWEGEYENRGSRNVPYTFMGIKADTIDLYMHVQEYDTNKEVRIRTGVQLTGRDYYYAKWKYTDDVYSNFYDAEQEIGLRAVEMEDAFYAIPATSADCIGEAALYRIDKADMVSCDYREEDRELLYREQEYGKADPLCSFPVNAENRILGLTEIGADRLLLSRTEQDRLLLELYDLNGNLLFRKDTDIMETSRYRLEDIQLIEKEENAVLWVELMQVVKDETDPQQNTYLVEDGRYFVIEKDTIEMLSETSPVDYLDYQDGTYLKLRYEAPKNMNAFIQKFWGYHIGGYEMQVIADETGTVLYHGRLLTDFGEDYTKMLSCVNIGQYQEPLEERREEKGIFGERAYLVRIRALQKALPMHGTLKGMTWEADREIYYGTDHYYY